MNDQYGRKITYMRISITERCNLNCRYCMPKKQNTCMVDRSDELSQDEIVEIVRCAASLGIDTYRITGGEPLVRKDCAALIQKIKKIQGVSKVALTTNGMYLEKEAACLKKAGLDQINVSLDTVDPISFQNITGVSGLEHVIKGIDAVKKEEIPVKINVVSTAETDWEDLLLFGEEKQIPIRFIEMMPIGEGKRFLGYSNDEVLKKIERKYGKGVLTEEKTGSGPAVYYRFDKLTQPVGLISALGHMFCASCNRVRVTSSGRLKLCLCYEDGVDLRALCDGSHEEPLKKAMYYAIEKKPQAHRFYDIKDVTEHKNMVQIGG